MKLEKGKFYRTRSGEKVECLTTEANGEQPVIILRQKGNIRTCHLSGEYYYDKRESPNDIISEWSDVEIHWEDYPRWCNWVAMDESGNWYCYSDEPEKGRFSWYGVGFSTLIPYEYAPKGFTGDWKESKFERPKKD